MSDRGSEHKDESENQNKEEDKMDIRLASPDITSTPLSMEQGPIFYYNGREGGNRMAMETVNYVGLVARK